MRPLKLNSLNTTSYFIFPSYKFYISISLLRVKYFIEMLFSLLYIPLFQSGFKTINLMVYGSMIKCKLCDKFRKLIVIVVHKSPTNFIRTQLKF